MSELQYVYLMSGRYRLYSDGTIYSVNRDKFITPTIRTTGKKSVKIVVLLDENHKSKCFTLHVLVASYFVPNPNHYKCVLTYDHDYLNCDASNLFWSPSRFYPNTQTKKDSKNNSNSPNPEDYCVRHPGTAPYSLCKECGKIIKYGLSICSVCRRKESRAQELAGIDFNDPDLPYRNFIQLYLTGITMIAISKELSVSRTRVFVMLNAVKDYLKSKNPEK